MGRILTSPVPRFPGTVELIDSPTPELLGNFIDAASVGKFKISRTTQCFARFDSTNAFIKEWHIEGQPEKPTLDTLVLIPKTPLRDLLEWLIDSVDYWLEGEQEIPKDLVPAALPTPQQAETSPAN